MVPIETSGVTDVSEPIDWRGNGAVAFCVAQRIISDFRGLTIDADDQQTRTEELHLRIARALMAFQRFEGHLEPK